MAESLLSFSEVLLFGTELDDIAVKAPKSRGRGNNKHLSQQFSALTEKGDDCDPDDPGRPQLAKIYGFSYEGTYFDLPEPAIFLVYGPGTSATDGNMPGNLASRAPNEPLKSGVGAADFQIADGIMFWPMEKSEQTIRMDVMSGRVEQVLLEVFFGDDGPSVRGAKVSGAKVSGAKVSGAKVSGAKVSGAKVSGAKVRGGD